MTPGLDDAVHDAQQAFRAALDALARPASVRALGRTIPGLPLGGAMAHLLLTLTDEDTPVWWQRPDASLARWLRFHTGARSVERSQEAVFAVVTEPASMPGLDAFDAGTAASPEHSCTLFVELPSLQGGPLLHGHGPGIRERAALSPAGLPANFWSQWQANHAAFPQGVDLFFTCGERALGLPRTTRIARLEEV
jgi:alpha-D-ribose 1-methylphosphonate 5-triphosphate synthase subunit PhnH